MGRSTYAGRSGAQLGHVTFEVSVRHLSEDMGSAVRGEGSSGEGSGPDTHLQLPVGSRR